MDDASNSPPYQGRVITFYSYTGGTGRTTTLANVAWILASSGHRVLAVDWNLNSPGLHKLLSPFLQDKDLRNTTGVMDLIRDFSVATMIPPGDLEDDDSPNWHLDYAKVQDHCVRLNYDFPKDGHIDLLSAGRQGFGYSATISAFDWDNFYQRLRGGAFLQAVRDDMRAAYDYVLIDSSSGLSDTAALCTVQLPDAVAMCCRLTGSSIDGGVAIARSIQSQAARLRHVDIFPVLMLTDASEPAKLTAAQEYARDRFAPVMRERDREAAQDYWARAEIPYLARFSYEELLAPFGQPRDQEPSERLTDVLTDGSVTRLAPMRDRERQRWRLEFERPRMPVDEGKRRDPASEVSISYAASDRIWAEWLRSELQSHGVRCLLRSVDGDEAQTLRPSPDSWTLVLLSEKYVSAAQAGELWHRLRADHNTADLIVPIRLDNAALPAPFSDVPSLDLAVKAEPRARAEVLAALNHSVAPATEAGEANGSGTRFPASSPALSNLGDRFEFFAGRAQLLEEIRNVLATSGYPIPTVVLHGLDGMGKAKVAAEYAHRFAADYDVVWWVPLEGTGHVRNSLSPLAEALDIHRLPQSAGSALQAVLTAESPNAGLRRLVIFDAVSDPVVLAQDLPRAGSAHVIIVSSQVPASLQTLTNIKVDVFSRDDSIACLTDRVPSLSHQNARRIAELLGDVPLLIEQAAAWLRNAGRSGVQSLLSTDSPPQEAAPDSFEAQIRNDVARMWVVSLRRLKTENPAATRLAELCAFFGEAPIPRRLLESNRVLTLLHEFGMPAANSYELGRIIELLGDFAVVRVNRQHETLEMHRLLRQAVRSPMSAEQQVENYQLVWEILVEAKPRWVEDVRGWPEYRELWPHVQARARYAETDKARQLVADSVRYSWRQGNWGPSRQLAEDVIASWSERFGENDTLTLLMRYHRTNVLWSQGLYHEAETEAAEVVTRFERELGAEHENTLVTATVRAACLRALGDFTAARELDESTLERFQRALSAHPNDPRALNAASNLAVSLRLVGDFGRARELDELTLQRRRSTLGPRHHWTLMSDANLAWDLRELGDLQGSYEYLDRAREGFLAAVGERHEDTIRTLNSLAVTRRKMGDVAEALALTKQAQALVELVFEPGHPDELALRLNRAADESAQGDHVAAERIAAEVTAAYESRFGGEHPFTLAASVNQALYARLAGRAHPGFRRSEQTRGQLSDRLGEKHPWALAARVNHGGHLAATSGLAAARGFDEKTYPMMVAVHGAAHPDVFAAGLNLVLSREAAGDIDEANELWAIVADAIEAHLDRGHPYALAVAARNRRLDLDIALPPT